MPREIVKVTLIWIIIAVSSCLETVLYCQEIRLIRVSENFVRPLKDDYNITFHYRTLSKGTISAYLNNSLDAFFLVNGRTEFRGPGQILLPLSKIQQWMRVNSFRNMTQAELVLSHLSPRTNRTTESKTVLKFSISAPYGYELLPHAPKPQLLSTYNINRVKKPHAAGVVSIVLGSATVVGGVIYGIEEDSFFSETNSASVIIGVGIALIGMGSIMHKYVSVPDVHKNDMNRRRNEIALSQWRSNTNNINRQNELIRNTFTIRISL